MSQLATLALARASDAREIAEMSRDLIEQGLTWSWTPARVQHFIMGAESSVVVARRARGGDAWRGDPAGDVRRGGPASDVRRGEIVPRGATPRMAAPREAGTRKDAQSIAAFAIMHFGDDGAPL